MGKSCSGKSCMARPLSQASKGQAARSKEAMVRAVCQAPDQRTYQSDEAAQDLCGCCGLRAAGPSPTARERPEAETSSRGKRPINGKRKKRNEMLSSRSRGRLTDFEIISTQKTHSPTCRAVE